MSTPAAALAHLPRGALLRRLGGEPVPLALAAGVGLLAFLDPAQTWTSIAFVAGDLLSIAPFLLLAVAIAGAARASGADQLIARAFAGHPLRAIAGATLVGALSPFCSCGVIPLVAALLGAGVPLAPVMAFWISSPIMDPEMFVLTAAGIGPGFALAKLLATIAMGSFAGFAVLALQRGGRLRAPLRAAGNCGGCCNPVGGGGAVVWQFWRDADRRRLFTSESVSTVWFLGKWLTLAFFLESLMVAYVPSDWIGATLGGDNAFAIPLAALVGVPAYLNGYAAIPLVSGLLDMGMDRGAALAFMTAGAVSSVPAAIAVWALVRRPVFALYLALGVSGSIATGALYAVLG